MIRIIKYIYKQTIIRHLKIILIAAIIDMIWGDPQKIYKKIQHPIIWIGNLITYLDKKLNQPHLSKLQQKQNGIYSLIILTFIPTIMGLICQKIIFKYLTKSIATFLSGVICSIFIARRSLFEHVETIIPPLESNNLIAARNNLSKIVGRKTDNLDQSSIIRASIESLSENFSDGVTAPIFWGSIAGIPGIIAYKAINTADSMIAHKTKKYLYFGYATAKIDDYINLPASRLSALWIIIASKLPLFSSINYIYNEAKKHNSPNAGWPESAMAESLYIQLAGPREYQDHTVNTPWIGKGRNDLNINDLKKALSIFNKSCNIHLYCIIFMILINQIWQKRHK